MNEMTPKISKAAQVGFALSLTGPLVSLAVLGASFLPWSMPDGVEGIFIAVILLCPVLGLALSLLARRDIERSNGQLGGAGLANAGAIIGLLGLFFARSLII